ncbi:hypothetical protein Nepgr_017402 [Nepenthes gracilis]|uniref:Uncharacterized protein n=1 Tax=Nepenthes gracilis TaxID=150966 RepID=A0AAD3SSL0_NEPGR|nr:hypothetical protein Nepgr_017402 [Nepenthes gracilis]
MTFDEHFCSVGLCGGGQTDVPRCEIFTGLLLPPDVAELCCCRFVQFCCSLGPASSKLGVDLAGAVCNWEGVVSLLLTKLGYFL